MDCLLHTLSVLLFRSLKQWDYPLTDIRLEGDSCPTKRNNWNAPHFDLFWHRGPRPAPPPTTTTGGFVNLWPPSFALVLRVWQQRWKQRRRRSLGASTCLHAPSSPAATHLSWNWPRHRHDWVTRPHAANSPSWEAVFHRHLHPSRSLRPHHHRFHRSVGVGESCSRIRISRRDAVPVGRLDRRLSVQHSSTRRLCGIHDPLALLRSIHGLRRKTLRVGAVPWPPHQFNKLGKQSLFILVSSYFDFFITFFLDRPIPLLSRPCHADPQPFGDWDHRRAGGLGCPSPRPGSQSSFRKLGRNSLNFNDSAFFRWFFGLQLRESAQIG